MELPGIEEVKADAARVAELVKYFEESKDWDKQEKVFEMLAHIDHMHRACIWRLFQLTTELGGQGLMDRIQLDPVIKTLFVLYDLLPPESPFAPEHQPKDFDDYTGDTPPAA
jgi:cephalosporin-C deacetylase-like acetyl esterase